MKYPWRLQADLAKGDVDPNVTVFTGPEKQVLDEAGEPTGATLIEQDANGRLTMKLSELASFLGNTDNPVSIAVARDQAVSQRDAALAERDALQAQLDALRSTPPPVNTVITDWQFALGLAGEDIITRDEALAFVRTGTIPAHLQAIVDGISDPDARFKAEVLLSGATTFHLDHPLTQAIAAAYGWTREETQQAFAAWSQL
jgi:hypothetical protein